jgi:serine/threonine-protein kinase RsbW
MDLDVALCLPREAETVSLIRGIVCDALGKLGVTPDCVDDVRLALSEACTNVVDHATDDDEYEVRLRVENVICHISVTNTTSGFDAESLADVMPSTSSARGRGVAIMSAVMDHVAFHSEPAAGTVVHLVKTLEVRPDGALARLVRQRSHDQADHPGT